MESIRKSILAGIMIGIGSTIYLTLDNRIIGSILFSIGLFIICSFGMFLYTGKIGYVIKTKNKPNCFIIWIGNLVGSIIISIIIRFAKPELHQKAIRIVNIKLQQNIMSIIILSVLCGFLMFLAVDNYSKHKDSLSGIIGIFLCVSTFILCGFEHSIADMNFIILSIEPNNQIIEMLGFIFIVSIFNGIGALLIQTLIYPVAKRKEK